MSVRIGFLGTGFMGQLAHLENYLRVSESEVVALAEIRPDLGRKVAAHYGIPSVYRSHEELLADDSVDSVVASQPFHRNYYLGREVLRSGKHLFTEKPMVGTVDDAKELVTLAEEANVSVWRESRGTWTEERLFAPVEWAFYRQAVAFVQAVFDGTDLPTSGDKCLADVALIEDIFRKHCERRERWNR